MDPKFVHVHIHVNGDYYRDVCLAAIPFIGAGIALQEGTSAGTIVMLRLRVVDVSFISNFHGEPSVHVYCTERE